jgi:NAD(P)-dependent dehydrogenase (short-subunit alcohol dehydrogenase family)
VTSVESLAAAAREVVARAGGVNLLCANAGVLARIGLLEDHSIEDWEYTFSVNVIGVVKTVSAFLPALRASAPEAHILNTASLGGITAEVRAPLGAYIASKYACVGYSEMLRAELASQGIGVSVLCPGVVASNLTATSAEHRPEGFGEQTAPELASMGGAGAAAAALAAHTMPAEEVGPIVVRAIRANRLHVLTHPKARPLVEGRFRALLADFEFAASE